MRRDLRREASYPPIVRSVISQWIEMRAKARRLGRIRWESTYSWIDEELAAGREREVIAELSKAIDEARDELERRRRGRRLAAAERLWERQAVTIDADRRPRDRDLAGRNVWLWHGTSSELLPKIREVGLLATPPRRTHGSSTPGYVYLTAQPGGYFNDGGSAVFYARSAAGKHGGDPVLLRVVVPWDDLEPDEDDAELECGRVQFRTSVDVPPQDIREIGEERVGWPEKWPKYRNPGHDYGLILVNTRDGLGVIMIDATALKRISADGTLGESTCPAGLGYAVVKDGRVKRSVARDGWLGTLLHTVDRVISDELLVLKRELSKGETAVEEAAKIVGATAEEVVGELLSGAEAWAEWALLV